MQAAAIVGNLDQESGASSTAVQAAGPGAASRSGPSAVDGTPTRATTPSPTPRSKARRSTTSTLQLGFIWYELTTFSGYGLASLKAATNVTDATVAFQTDFEGCGQCDQSQRVAYANAVLPSCAPPDYAAQFVSQSFPLASTTMTMTAGQVVTSYIELKNVGAEGVGREHEIWTTQPRGRASVFADGPGSPRTGSRR